MAHTWREAPMPPLEGEVPNEREAEGFVRQQSSKPLSFAALSSSPFRGAEAASPLRVAKLATPTVDVCKPVSEWYVTGRVRESTYSYKPCASLSGGTAAAGGFYPPLLDVLFILLYVLKSNLSY